MNTFLKSAKSANRDLVVLRILKIYFVLKDVVDDGEALICEAGPDPVATLNGLYLGEVEAVLQRWNAILDKQGKRLRFLGDKLIGQDHLEIIDPGLLQRLEEAIGEKTDRVFTLYTLGAGLVFRQMLAGLDSKDETPNYILAMAAVPEGSTTIDMEAISADIIELRAALDRYRVVTEKLVSREEFPALSSRARQETEL